MAQSVADKKTMLVCFGEVEGLIGKIKNAINEIEDIARYLETQNLSGGDGDLITKGIRDGVEVLRQVMAKEKADLFDVLDEKIIKMKTMTSDQSNVAGSSKKLKENAANVSALKR